MLDVPLDYSNPTSPSRAAVPLIKIPAHPANDSDYLGMLLTNPGGPGEPGVDFLLTSGNAILLPIIGPNYDIVSFDPRGMGRSIPRANCTSDSSPTETANTDRLRRRAFGLSGPELPPSYWDATFLAARELGEDC